MQRAGRERVVRDAIDQDESTQIAAALIRLECNGTVQLEFADTDFIQFEPLGGQMLPGVDVELVLERGHGRRDRGGADFHPI